MQRGFRRSKKSSLADQCHEPMLWMGESPGSANTDNHVVIVMDGLKDFTMEPLVWALQNVSSAGFAVTLLGLMPWLNIPLSSKTRLDVWMLEFEALNINVKDKTSESRSDAKYLKLQAVLDLCRKYGVLPQKEVVMGYPHRLLVIERIINLHATWVVFDSDKYHKKHREFYVERIPCNMVMMNEEGGFEVIKRWPMTDVNGENSSSTPGESPTCWLPTPQPIISQHLKQIPEETETEEGDDGDYPCQ